MSQEGDVGNYAPILRVRCFVRRRTTKLPKSNPVITKNILILRFVTDYGSWTVFDPNFYQLMSLGSGACLICTNPIDLPDVFSINSRPLSEEVVSKI